MELAVFGLLLTLAVLLGIVFGWIAFFRSMRVDRELKALRSEVLSMAVALREVIAIQRGEAAPRATPASPAPKPAAQPAPVAPSPIVVEPEPPVAPAATLPLPSPADEQRAAMASNPVPPLPTPPAHDRNIFHALEASLAGNWLVWVAGVALAFGGVFLVKVAIDTGLLGPEARIVLAYAAGGGMIAASEWLRRRGFDQLPGFARSAAPAVTAGAGLITVYGATYAAFGIYQLLPAPLAFVMLAATAAGAALLALRHGPALVALGLVGAFVAPILIGSTEPEAGPLFAYVFAVAAAGLAITRMVDRRWPGLVALAGGAIWALIWIDATQGSEPWVLALYLPALLGAGILFAWDQAEHAPMMVASRRLIREAPVAVSAAYAAAVVVFMIQLILLGATSFDETVVASLAATTVIAMTAAWRREALFALPMIAVGAVCLSLYAWPDARAVFISSQIQVERALGADAGPGGPPYLSTCLGFAALFGLGGLFAQDRLRVKGAMALVAAAGPTLILAIAYWRIQGLDQDWRWAGIAVLLATAYTFLLERLARSKDGADAFPGPVSAYAIAACGAAGMAVGMALEQLWMSVGFGILAPVAALLHRRFKLVLLQWAAVAFGLIATARLTINPEVYSYNVGDWPIVNGLLWGYGVPILAIWAAARIFMKDGLPRNGQVVQALHAKALLLAVALVSMQIHHLLNEGDLSRLYFNNLLEVGLQSSAWFAGALVLRLRLGPNLFFVQRWAERLLIAAAVIQTVVVQLWWINPWWGPSPQPVAGPPFANELFVAYALPAILAAMYALLARRQGFVRIGTTAGMASAALGFAWVTLETRHAFHPLWLDREVMTNVERYAYSAVWLVFAALLLAFGALRRRPSMRYAALMLLVIVTLKVFFFDMAGLEGVLRGLSFIGLGAALMAIALLYQRLGPALSKQDDIAVA